MIRNAPHPALALLLLLLAGGCSKAPDAQTDPAAEVAASTLTAVGDTAPDFSLPLLGGAAFTLSEHSGKVVLVNWWATWCPPCREEIPHLRAEVWDRFQGPDFTMISISREETPEVAGAYAAEHGMAWPQAVDPDRSVYGKYASAYIPRNYVIGPDGRIVFQSQGYEPEEFAQMIDIIRGELDRIPPPRP